MRTSVFGGWCGIFCRVCSDGIRRPATSKPSRPRCSVTSIGRYTSQMANRTQFTFRVDAINLDWVLLDQDI